jgi:hypothetical protein
MYPDSLFTRFAKWTSRATGGTAQVRPKAETARALRRKEKSFQELFRGAEHLANLKNLENLTYTSPRLFGRLRVTTGEMSTSAPARSLIYLY